MHRDLFQLGGQLRRPVADPFTLIFLLVMAITGLSLLDHDLWALSADKLITRSGFSAGLPARLELAVAAIPVIRAVGAVLGVVEPYKLVDLLQSLSTIPYRLWSTSKSFRNALIGSLSSFQYSISFSLSPDRAAFVPPHITLPGAPERNSDHRALMYRLSMSSSSK